MSKRAAEQDPEDASSTRRQKLEPDAAADPSNAADTGVPVSLKALITNREAALLIGREGSTIAGLRTQTGAQVSVSEHAAGAVERVLSVTGTPHIVQLGYTEAMQVLYLDATALPATANVTGQEDAAEEAPVEKQTPAPKKKGGRKSAATKAAEAAAAEAVAEAAAAAEATPVAPSSSTTKPISLRLIIPHAHLGALIGKQGVQIRTLMADTGAHIQASEFNLPLSSERCVIVRGGLQQITRALGKIAETMQQGLSSMSVALTVAYKPVTLGGVYGHPDSFRRVEPNDSMKTPSNPYGIPPSTFAAPAQTDTQAVHAAGGASSGPGGKPAGKSKEKITQQIYIPNDMVGAIIGKQGCKINEIRTLSGSHVKVNEPDPARVTERLITIEGTAEQNQLALYLLYQRLESEKRR